MSATFELRIDGGVGSLILHPDRAGRPPTFDHSSLNRLNATLVEIEKAIAQEHLRLLFIRSASDKFFCTGANIAALRDLDEQNIEAWVTHGHRIFDRLEILPVPTVARVEGFALGGGLELALSCDLIFTAAHARLGQTEASLGFVAGWGGSHRLPRRIGRARAAELFYTARIVPADEAARFDLIDFCGTAMELEAHCDAFAEQVLKGSAVAHAGHKRLLRLASVDSSSAAVAEAGESRLCLQSPDTNSRIQAFLDRRK